MRALSRFIGWTAGLVLLVLVGSKWLLAPDYSIAVEILIQAPAARVWEKVGDLNQWPSWVKGFEQFDVTSGGGNEAGSTAHGRVYTGFQGIEMDLRIREYRPGFRLRYDILGGPQDGVISTLELSPNEEGRFTRLRWIESQTPGGVWGNIKAAVLRSVVTTHHEESLNQLKFKVERGG